MYPLHFSQISKEKNEEPFLFFLWQKERENVTVSIKNHKVMTTARLF
jgi:hypothetical protein